MSLLTTPMCMGTTIHPGLILAIKYSGERLLTQIHEQSWKFWEQEGNITRIMIQHLVCQYSVQTLRRNKRCELLSSSLNFEWKFVSLFSSRFICPVINSSGAHRQCQGFQSFKDILSHPHVIKPLTDIARLQVLNNQDGIKNSAGQKNTVVHQPKVYILGNAACIHAINVSVHRILCKRTKYLKDHR